MKTIGNACHLRVLLIEDSSNDALLIVREMERGGLAVDTERVDNAEMLKEMLHSRPWDLIISDYSMPHFSGAEALSIIRNTGFEMPFIFVSGSMGEHFAVEAIKLGAHDYITKDNLQRLVGAIHTSLKEAARAHRRREAEARLQRLAHYDALTDLPNRTLFNDRMEQALREARRHSRLVAVGFLDLNRFKLINDSMGHEVGDLLLQLVAQRLRLTFRESDTVARLSGDEFTFLLPGVRNRKDTEKVARKVLEVFSRPFTILNQNLTVHASLGLALFPSDGENGKQLLRNADAAMYQAKKIGGNQYKFCNSKIADGVAMRLDIENGLKFAIQRDEFFLHYQPEVENTSNRIKAVEALIRWCHPKYGLLEPGKFIPIFEEVGLISNLGEWVLRSACFQSKKWQQKGVAGLRIAINCSAHQFWYTKFAELVTGILSESGISSESLEIEITESVLMQDNRAVQAILKRFRNAGIRLVLDDFGTGFSSLNYLKRLPFNSLKIDRSFVRDIPHNPDSVAITSAIIAMAHKLGIEVVAEGVETHGQLEFLKAEGCEMIQGYYLCPPCPDTEIERCLLSGKIDIADR
ncbi:MAG: EAL domain-containing protein [Gammaproteobacteria bacterium]